jgi:hypothetical protein
MKLYCIYTDKLIEEEKANKEHIFPLSLGGCNDFCIYVDKLKNSEIGSMIDGKLGNDFLISFLRIKKNLKGHSGKTPELVLKNSIDLTTNKPIQVKFKDKGSVIYDPINKKEISKSTDIQSSFRFNPYLRAVFTAKVLLATGYFVYRDIFRNHADHESLRQLMNFGINEDNKTLQDLPLRFTDLFHHVEEDSEGLNSIFKMICEGTDGSCVIFMLCDGNILGTVGISGQYIGTIGFNADTTKFPNDNLFRLGHVIGIQNKLLTGSSFYNVVGMLQKML